MMEKKERNCRDCLNGELRVIGDEIKVKTYYCKVKRVHVFGHGRVAKNCLNFGVPQEEREESHQEEQFSSELKLGGYYVRNYLNDLSSRSSL